MFLPTTSPFILLLIAFSLVKLASNEFADFLPRWGMRLDYYLEDFLHLSLHQQKTKDQQQPMYLTPPPPFPFPIALPFYVLIWYQFINVWNYRRGKEVQKFTLRGIYWDFFFTS
jgi:hypothetical protein